MNEWQPIETAPKDGTAILAYGLCLADVGSSFGPKTAVVIHDPNGGDYSWRLDGGGPYPTGMKATHWMPLPIPPK
jgi:hypothetical protein